MACNRSYLVLEPVSRDQIGSLQGLNGVCNVTLSYLKDLSSRNGPLVKSMRMSCGTLLLSRSAHAVTVPSTFDVRVLAYRCK